jgi:dipeptidyl aminopeptidase/acylaminoacyl peptidase
MTTGRLRLARLAAAAIFIVSASSLAPRAQAPAKHPITFGDMERLERIADPQISPDGKSVVYQVTTPDMDGNRNATNIWMISTSGGPTIQLTRSGHDSEPVWSPDSRMIAFISSREGSSQVYLLPLSGGEPRALTHLSTQADLPKWSPDGRLIAFTSSVHPDCLDDACNKAKDEEREKSKVKVRIYDQLLFRHWNHWSEGKRSHLFVVAADGSTPPRDLLPMADFDVPPDERGGPEDVNFSPDSKELAFVAVRDKVEAISTNGDICLVPTSGGAYRCITTANQGFDGNPVYSPDGRFIAYHAQLTAGYESDRWRVMQYDRSTHSIQNLTDGFDRSASQLAWSPDSQTIYFQAENETLQPIYALAPRAGAQPRKLVDGFNGAVSISSDGRTIAFTRSTIAMPNEVYLAGGDGTNLRQLTHQNDVRLAALDLSPAETFWFDSTDHARVQAMIVRPPDFNPTRKYPLLVKLHGGPQDMQGNSWGYRWNEQLFAAAGYVVLDINRRGSTGYGQKFTDAITDDWGGKAYDDVMKGVDETLAKYPFVDGARIAAAGGSYGGYLADWIATHTDRFKAIISHAGPSDKLSMYGGTEELWFEEHDMKGTPWTSPEAYRKCRRSPTRTTSSGSRRRRS